MDWVVLLRRGTSVIASYYFDRFSNIEFAIAREKEIKGWRRRKKDKLVESLNPDWKDLAAGWYTDELLFDGKPVK
jgi:predicted GIY-YIG superfamily endonuclease